MRRILVPSLLAFLAAGLLSACDAQFTPYAARVDGTSISQSSFDSALASLRSDPGVSCFSAQLHGASHVTGAASGSYNSAFAAGLLSIMIDAKIAGRLHIAVSPFDRQVTEQQIISGFRASSTANCSSRAEALYEGLPAGFRDRLVTFQSTLNVLAARAVGVPLTPAGISSYEAAHPARSSLDCTSVIEVATLAKADQLASAIKGGAGFASEARSNSLDASAASGGALGCIPASFFKSPLDRIVAQLPAGKPSPVVKFATIYLLFEVTSRPLLSPVEAAAEVVLPAGTRAASGRFGDLLRNVNVSVDPRFGHWVRASATVDPPAGPPLSLVPDPAAVHATSAFS